MGEEHSVTIRWGSSQAQSEIYDDSEAGHTYTFDSVEELDAFLKGVRETQGWAHYKILDDS